MSDATPKIEVEALRLAYETKEVIHGISFAVEPNEILAVTSSPAPPSAGPFGSMAWTSAG
jgi:ABC-type phosphate transport system ATPase subunit